MELTQERLKELMHYNEDTGIFTCAEHLFRSNVKLGESIGTPNGKYLYTTIKGAKYAMHRLAFLYMEGELPKASVDHGNHITTDNRWSNISHATYQENQRNRSMDKRNASGFNGVNWCKRVKKWRARISISRSDIHLGHFIKLSDAIQARKEANIKHGFHENHGQEKK